MYAIMYTRRTNAMLNINITHFRKNIFEILEQTIRFNEPINVTTKNGNAVVLSEEDYNGLIETLNLSSIPGMKEKIVDGLKTPLSECIPESEVEW
jgi:antitoxin YefM